MFDGVVVKNTGSWYTVKSYDNKIFDCKIKGNFRIKGIRSTNPVAVGDKVGVSQTSQDAYYIVKVYERKNQIIRRASNLSKQSQIIATNLDLLALVVTVNYPVTYLEFIDRFLANAEAYNVPACIVINKIDRYSDEELSYAQSIKFLYETIGYQVFLLSALQEDTLNELKDVLADKITLFSGNSGVGKSTLISQLLPGVELRVSEISEYHNRGMHTTTFSEMFELPNEDGYIIDTPGIKGFGSIDLEKNEIGHYFKEIFKFSKDCKFHNCTHTHEPDCAVLKALDKHYISQSRYNSYLSMLDEKLENKYR